MGIIALVCYLGSLVGKLRLQASQARVGVQLFAQGGKGVPTYVAVVPGLLADEVEDLAAQRDGLLMQLQGAQQDQQHLVATAAQLEAQRDELLHLIDDLSVQVASAPPPAAAGSADAAVVAALQQQQAQAQLEVERLQALLAERQAQLEASAEVGDRTAACQGRTH